MDQNENIGGAGPALAAHSKDGSAPGPTAASSTVGTNQQSQGNGSENSSGILGQAPEAVQRFGSAVSETASAAASNLSGQSARLGEMTSTFVREQPFVAAAVTGAVCLAIGVMLGRR